MVGRTIRGTVRKRHGSGGAPVVPPSPPVIEAYELSVSSGSTSNTAIAPAGIVPGELLVIIFSSHFQLSDFDNVTPPAGWNELVDKATGGSVDCGIHGFWKIAEEGDGNVVYTAQDAFRAFAQVYMRISGVDDADPIDATAGPSDGLSTKTVPGHTTTRPNCLSFAALTVGDDGNLATGVSSEGWEFMLAYTSAPTAGISDAWIALATKEMATAGPTGNCTFVSPAGFNSQLFSFAVAGLSA